MSDFTNRLSGLADAFDALAKRASEIEERQARLFAALEGQAAAMRSAVEYARHRWIDKESMAIMDAALAVDAGKGWVSPEAHAKALKAHDERVRATIGYEVAELYARIGGMTSSAAAFVAVLTLLNTEPR